MNQLEDVQALEQQNQRRLLLEDLIDIEKKKDEANKVFR